MKRFRIFGSQSGNMLVVLVVATASAALMSSSLSSMIGRLDVLNRDTSRQQIYESALSSLLNYTRAGIKRRWCFTPNWDQDVPTDCNLAHSRSSERLLISPNGLRHIHEMIAANPSFPHANPIVLEGFGATVDLHQLNDTHPIKKILSGGDFAFAGSVRFQIDRMRSSDLPTNGDEAFLRISVDLLPKSGQAFPQNRPRLGAWSKVSVYPREVGTFALFVPGDLYLGSSGRLKGDVAFPAGSGAGVVFDSPVFVNGNINLPPSAGSSYTPVAFSAQVVQGAGMLKRNGAPFTTKTAGGFMDATYAKMNGFAGFLSGIQSDGERDIGLDQFSGRVTSAKPDNSLMNACIKRNALKSDLEKTKGSALLARSRSDNVFDLAWTMNNYFRDQNMNGSPNKIGDFHSVHVSGGRSAIGELGVKIGTTFQVQQIYLSRTGSVEIVPKTAGPASDAPKLTVSITPFSNNGVSQDNIATLKVMINDPKNKLDPFSITFRGFETSTFGGSTTRRPPNVHYPTMKLTYAKNAASKWFHTPAFSSKFTRADGSSNSYENLAVDENWQELEIKCKNPGDDPTTSFQPSSWDITFDMRTSWTVRPANRVIFSDTNAAFTDPEDFGIGASMSSANLSFNIFSIAKECEIQASANFVAGFFVCEKLRISPRSTPLRLIGTFVVNQLDISPSAYTAGIRWSSIYNVNSVFDLRSANILKAAAGGSCEINPNEPIWSPFLDVGAANDLGTCNSIFLRGKFDNIRWTTIDPDQGLDPMDLNATKRKNHPVRFVVMEYDRGYL